MFCVKCGKEIPEGAVFCPACGNSVAAQEAPAVQAEVVAQPTPVAQTEVVAPATPSTADKVKDIAEKVVVKAKELYAMGEKKIGAKNMPFAVGAAAVALVILLIIILAGGNSSPTGVVDKYLDSIVDCNADKFMDCFHDDVLEMVADEEFDGSMKKLKKELKANLKDYKEDLEELDSFNVVGSSKVTSSELKSVKEMYDESFDLKVTDAAEVNVEASIEGEKDTESFYVVKIGGKWYMHALYLAMIG